MGCKICFPISSSKGIIPYILHFLGANGLGYKTGNQISCGSRLTISIQIEYLFCSGSWLTIGPFTGNRTISTILFGLYLSANHTVAQVQCSIVTPSYQSSRIVLETTYRTIKDTSLHSQLATARMADNTTGIGRRFNGCIDHTVLNGCTVTATYTHQTTGMSVSGSST